MVPLAVIGVRWGYWHLVSCVSSVLMAVTIVVGLTFATVLTLIVVPTLFTVFFKIRKV